MSRIQDELTRYGVNLKIVMERFIEDEDFYLDCLRGFMADSNFEKLLQDLTAEDYENAFVDAHTLKGVAGNLELTPLFQKVSNLVEELRAKDYQKASLMEKCRQILEEKEKIEKIIID